MTLFFGICFVFYVLKLSAGRGLQGLFCAKFQNFGTKMIDRAQVFINRAYFSEKDMLYHRLTTVQISR